MLLVVNWLWRENCDSVYNGEMKTKTCANCQKEFPQKAIINGEAKNLQNRKYCLDCSPHGKHNTCQIHINPKTDTTDCISCGKTFKWRKGLQKCNTCYATNRREKIRHVIRDIVGDKCWRCSYGGPQVFGVLNMHHVYPENKLFGLGSVFAHSKPILEIIDELKKCVCLCVNCHGEYHHSYTISDEEIIDLYNINWNRINNTIDINEIIENNFDTKLIRK